MSNPLVSLGNFLAPQPQIPWEEYEGTQFRWKFFVFRPGQLQLDLILFLIVVLYGLVFFVGKSTNASRADAWLNAHEQLFTEQFTRPGTRNRDGYSDVFVFSTGRRAVRSLHTVLRMLPRQDLLQMTYQFVLGTFDLKYRAEDRVTLDISFDDKTTAQIPDFVWAVVSKDELSSIREERWDLTFTKTTESSLLPPTLSVMTELADITDNLLKPMGNFSLPKLLSDSAALAYFRSLSISDQPLTRPSGPLKPELKRKYLSLTLAVPPPQDSGATRSLVAGILQLADALAGPKSALTNLRPETKTKLRKRRDELDSELRAEAEREAKEAEKEAKDNALAAKRQAEKDRIANLPATEQQKILERERKRQLRKQQGKVVRK